jgi:PhnB protein
MARTSTYLNFEGTTEQAFQFYRSVFGTEFVAPIMRMRDIPPSPDMPPLPEAEKDLVMHVALPILGGHVIMGTDVLPSMREKLVFGTNVSITLVPDTRVEADRLFAGLAEGGKVTMPLQVMFWGDYFGTLTDKFGVQWMVDTEAKA